MGLTNGIPAVEWSDLRLFLAIARAGSLGGAARKLTHGSNQHLASAAAPLRLGVTQPTMGRRLRALESALGHKLFQRTKVGFVLTDEGSAVLIHAERMEEEALAIERQIAGRAQHLEGSLRITASEWFATHVLAPVLAEFAAAHPHVAIELLADARFLSLSRCEADLAFRIRPFDESDVITRKLMHLHYAVYARTGTRRPSAGDGTGTNLIALDAGFAGVPDDSWLQAMLPKSKVVFRSNSRDVQAKMCAQGVGISVLPTLLGDGFPGLERLELGAQPPGRDTWLGYHRDLQRLSRLRALLDLVVARLAGD